MTETGLPEGLEQALHRLSAVLNNAALEWSDERSMEAVLVDYASERIATLEAENARLKAQYELMRDTNDNNLSSYINCAKEALALKAQVERLTAPVSAEEQEKYAGLGFTGDYFSMQGINKLIAARAAKENTHE